ncbi:MFS transporter [Saccharospirillum sp.]|uniref:MFS transporter n=1 Tax=Saccharospirillum sp. TaxID=2033801 RepID=UPI0034A09404
MTGVGQGFVAFAVSSLVKPIAGDLALGRGTVSMAVGLGRLTSGLVSPLAGYLSDRFGTRLPVLLGMLLLSLGLALMTFIQSATGLVIVWSGIVSAGVALGFMVALDKQVVQSTVHRRGLALAVRFSVVGIVTAILIPVVATMVNRLGWRTTCLVWSAFIFILIPFALALFRGSETTIQTQRASLWLKADNRVSQSGWRELITGRAFLLLGLGFMAQASVNSGLAVHLIPLVTDQGHSDRIAAGMLSSLVLMSIPVRLVTGTLADQLSPRALAIVFGSILITEGLSLVWFANWPTLVGLMAMLIMLAISVGAGTLIVMILVSRIYGEHRFGSVQGTLMLLQVPGTTLAPILTGYAFDLTDSYQLALLGFAGGLLAVGISLVIFRSELSEVTRP